jgi:hypothetical protein
MRKGVLPGEGAIREVAAFLLDQRQGHFSGVPPTALVSFQQHSTKALGVTSIEDVKVGSLQRFVVADGDCEERGSCGLPVHQVHKIAVRAALCKGA